MASYDVRLATRITDPVNLRLRMLALLKGQPLSHVLDSLLDQALPAADQMAVLLGNSQPVGRQLADTDAMLAEPLSTPVDDGQWAAAVAQRQAQALAAHYGDTDVSPTETGEGVGE